MIQKIITKYGLAVHLAFLAAVPLIVSSFAIPAIAGVALLWCSGITFEWLFLAPSLRVGESIEDARARVRSSVIRDPLFYFFVCALLFAAARWLNGGLKLAYNVEEAVWSISSPACSFLPTAAGDCGFLSFCTAVAIAVVVLCIRHGLGASARISFILIASTLTGIAGLTASLMMCCGNAFAIGLAEIGITGGSFVGSVYGLWFIAALAGAAGVESLDWKSARFPAFLAVAGNACGLVFFAPPPLTVLIATISILFSIFILVYLQSAVSSAALARDALLLFAGFLVPAFLCIVLAPEHIKNVKLVGIIPETAFPENFDILRTTLSRYARTIWSESRWCGAGDGTFALKAPFLAEHADWAFLPASPRFTLNGYMLLLAERGFLGYCIGLIGCGLLVGSYCVRFYRGLAVVFSKTDRVSATFTFSPIVWVGPLVFLAIAIEMLYDCSLVQPSFLIAAGALMAVSAAACPRGAVISSPVVRVTTSQRAEK